MGGRGGVVVELAWVPEGRTVEVVVVVVDDHYYANPSLDRCFNDSGGLLFESDKVRQDGKICGRMTARIWETGPIVNYYIWMESMGGARVVRAKVVRAKVVRVKGAGAVLLWCMAVLWPLV